MIRYMGAPNWKPATIEDLIYFQRGFDITKVDQKEGDVPVISSSGIKSFHSQCKVKGPGVVIGRKGTLGSVYYSKCDYWPHDTTLWSKDFKGNNPKFVYYALKLIRFEKFDAGAANPTLNRNHIHGLPITIPELTIQNDIVSILDKYDDLIENNKRRIELLEESARQLYKEWIVRFHFPGHEHVKIIDGVPEGWKNENFGNVAKIQKGKNITKDTAIEGSVPVVAGGLVPAYYHNVSNTECPVVTVSASGANAGYVSLYHEKIWASDCTYIDCANEQPIYFFYLMLKNRQNEITAMQKGAAQPHVYPKDLMRLRVIFPPQKLIVQFSEYVSDSFKHVENLQNQNKLLIKSRNILLPKLMSGEIAV